MSAFIFVPLLALTWIVGTAVASQAASFFLAILEATATPVARPFSWRGPSFKSWMRDGIEWPDGVFADYFAKGAYLAYLVVLWGGPAVLVGRLAAGDSPWASVIAGVMFWLLFPVGLLSSVSSQSRWTPFRAGLIVAFCRRPVQTLGFYLLSAPVLAVLVLTFDLVLIHTSKAALAWAAALAPVATLMFFVYARLLGRLGLVLTFAFPEEPEEDERPRRRRKRRKRPLHEYDPRTRMFGPTAEVPDEPPPRAQPPEMRGIQTPYDGEVTGYGVDYSGRAPVVEPPKPTPVMQFDDDDTEPIRALPPPEVSTDRQQVADKLANPPEREMALFARERVEEPANPYGAEAVTFLFDPKTVAPWVALTAGLVLLALMQRGLDLLRPAELPENPRTSVGHDNAVAISSQAAVS
jgi:hypothetical protein